MGRDSIARTYADRSSKLDGTINPRRNSRATGDFFDEFLAWRFIIRRWAVMMAKRKQ